jgi:putative transposase
MIRTYKYRIFPTAAQMTSIKTSLELCRELYNTCTEERRYFWELEHKKFTSRDQVKHLFSLLNREGGKRESLLYGMLSHTLNRVDHTWQYYYTRGTEDSGSPRVKSASRYKSFTVSPHFFQCDGQRIYLKDIGFIKVKFHRECAQKIKTLTVKIVWDRQAYISLVVELPNTLGPETNAIVGLDVGLTHFLASTEGKKVENPRFFQKDQEELARVQRNLRKLPKDTSQQYRRKKTLRAFGHIHARISRRRMNFCHQESRKIVQHYRFIATEDLNIARMLHTRKFSKSIQDASWGQFLGYLSYKAEGAGRQFVQVNPAFTTQTHWKCLQRFPTPISLSDRTVECPACHLGPEDRDVNAAQTILRIALTGVRLT